MLAGADANLRTILQDLVAAAGSLATLGANQHNLGSSHGDRLTNDAALLILTGSTNVAVSHVDALNQNLTGGGHGGENLALLALILAGQDYDFIASLNFHSLCPP